jgi:hypothetical protein
MDGWVTVLHLVFPAFHLSNSHANTHKTLHLVMKYGHNKNSTRIYRFHGLCSAVLESRQSLANNATANASVLFARPLYIVSTRFPPNYIFHVPTLDPLLFINTGIQYHHVGTMGAFGP